jgi:hypothetical protein
MGVLKLNSFLYLAKKKNTNSLNFSKREKHVGGVA